MYMYGKPKNKQPKKETNKETDGWRHLHRSFEESARLVSELVMDTFSCLFTLFVILASTSLEAMPSTRAVISSDILLKLSAPSSPLFLRDMRPEIYGPILRNI